MEGGTEGRRDRRTTLTIWREVKRIENKERKEEKKKKAQRTLGTERRTETHVFPKAGKTWQVPSWPDNWAADGAGSVMAGRGAAAAAV